MGGQRVDRSSYITEEMREQGCVGVYIDNKGEGECSGEGVHGKVSWRKKEAGSKERARQKSIHCMFYNYCFMHGIYKM